MPLGKKRKSVFWKSLTRKPWRVTAVSSGLVVAIGSLVTAIALYGWPDWTGIGRGQSVSVTTERDTQGNILKTVETNTSEPGKTLWDGLSLLGVPLSLAILGYWLQQQQQQQAEAASEEQREIAANEAREDALQVYFDRLSALLVDKNLLALAAKVYASDGETELELQGISQEIKYQLRRSNQYVPFRQDC
ncbi:hypothetical protein PN498_25150 [Oscillatoria sp. CS-180]|uniref:hypothetical protein n=1 Tax=Oscillatoria sp. CS-180 TaxID=3021720 RepID=UPI00232E8F76|nr:hypothetical protein [Oscillatoria sp. CS-180]MDB9529304.1 hypothetical protein [Oscillatoria sp. CS-180]